jgi:nucleoside-diphosphate-sugar epimerase
MRLLVTGATGYIGQRLVRLALASGHEVVAASRRRPGIAVDWVPFDFGSANEFILPAGIDAIVHLAADTSPTGTDGARELAAAIRLDGEAQRGAAQLVFVSSQTARKDAPTAYGRTKFLIEQAILARGGLVVRPGQVYGGAERGLFGTLVNLVRRLPVLPAFVPAPRVQPVHVDDLADALLRAAAIKDLPLSTLCIGSVAPVSFTGFLRSIAQGRVRKRRWWFPVPSFAVRVARWFLGARFGLDRLVSLFDLPAMDTQPSLCALGIELRPLAAGMARSGRGRRRLLLREARTVLKYVMKQPPSRGEAGRYVRCIERLRVARPLALPAFVHGLPASLALFDRRGAADDEVAWRLDAAVALGEAGVAGSDRFLRLGGGSGPVVAAARIARAVVLEATWRVLRILVAPLLRLRKTAA